MAPQPTSVKRVSLARVAALTAIVLVCGAVGAGLAWLTSRAIPKPPPLAAIARERVRIAKAEESWRKTLGDLLTSFAKLPPVKLQPRPDRIVDGVPVHVRYCVTADLYRISSHFLARIEPGRTKDEVIVQLFLHGSFVGRFDQVDTWRIPGAMGSQIVPMANGGFFAIDQTPGAIRIDRSELFTLDAEGEKQTSLLGPFTGMEPFVPDAARERIVVGAAPREPLRIFSADGTLLHTIPNDDLLVWSADLIEDRLLVADGGPLLLYDIGGPELLATLDAPMQLPLEARFGATSDEVIYCCPSDLPASRWRFSTGEKLGDLPGSPAAVEDLNVARATRLILARSKFAPGTLYAWDLDDPSQRAALDLGADLYDICVSYDGERVFALNVSGEVLAIESSDLRKALHVGTPLELAEACFTTIQQFDGETTRTVRLRSLAPAYGERNLVNGFTEYFGSILGYLGEGEVWQYRTIAWRHDPAPADEIRSQVFDPTRFEQLIAPDPCAAFTACDYQTRARDEGELWRVLKADGEVWVFVLPGMTSEHDQPDCPLARLWAESEPRTNTIPAPCSKPESRRQESDDVSHADLP